MFASTKWQFFVFKHKMAAVVLFLNKTWLPWYDAENDWKRMREMENRREGEKEEKKRASLLHSSLQFYPLLVIAKRKHAKNVTVYFLFIFSEKSLTSRKNYTCVKAPN